MRKSLLCLIASTMFFIEGFTQNPLIKQWDYRFGGTEADGLMSLKQTIDGGFILYGYSTSDVSGDKTQPNWDTICNSICSYDYWIIKTDSLGNKQWDKRFGGNNFDVLRTACQTSDSGYILGGYSYSDVSGDKTQPNWDTTNLTPDYWIVKIDSIGSKQWDKRFGGKKEDQLSCLQQTSDDGFILGGHSKSGISGDKTQASRGAADYWMIKIDSLGNKQWDKRFGGTEPDVLSLLFQTSDGGYILGGDSFSDSTGDKTQPSWGYLDCWIVKVNSAGIKQWDKRFGGTEEDHLYAMQLTSDGDILLGGPSNSDISGDKSQPNWDTIPPYTFDLWLVRTDSSGNKIWDKRFGGANDEDDFSSINQTSDNGFLLGGTSYSSANGDKTEFNLGPEQAWMIKIDSIGNKQWDKTIFTLGHDEQGIGLPINNGCYVFANTTWAGIGGYKTQPAWNNSGDYWFIKFCDTTATTDVQIEIQNLLTPITIFPNPFTDELIVKSLDPQIKAEIKIYDVFCRIVLSQSFKSSTNALQTTYWPQGIYFVEVISEKGKAVKKMVKQ